MAAGLQHGDVFAFLRGGQLDLAHGGVDALRERRQRRTNAGFEQRIRPFEQPRVAESASADHHAVRAGVCENADGILGLGHIAVGEHRDGNRLLDLPYRIPVSRAAVLLRTGAPVQRNSRRTGLLGHFRELHAVDVSLIPALAELDRHRHIDRRNDRRNDFGRLSRVFHQR